MNFLLLRAQIHNENYPYMIKDKWEEVDDFYLHLANQMLIDGYVTSSEVWYWGKPEFSIVYPTGLKIACHSSFSGFPDKINFDIIFCRSGFSAYNTVFMKEGANKARKIYYDGVNSRYCPVGMQAEFDVILTDTEKRANKIRKTYPNAIVDILIKGFKPPFYDIDIAKTWDICNITSIDTNKGQDILADALRNTDLKFINIGAWRKTTKRHYEELGINSFFTGRLQRYDVYKYLKRCKVAFVGGHRSSGCPRVILEYMAAGVPIVLLDDINVDSRYTPDFFCLHTNRKKLHSAIVDACNRIWYRGAISEYFKNNFSIKKCAESLAKYIS